MAAEKVCKAYLIAANGYDSISFSHAYVAKNIPIIARHLYAALNSGSTMSKRQFSAIRRLAHEIEVLAPACNEEGRRRDNSEYPWLDDKGDIQVPCAYGFPNIDDTARNIIPLVKLIRLAAQKYIA